MAAFEAGGGMGEEDLEEGEEDYEDPEIMWGWGWGCHLAGQWRLSDARAAGERRAPGQRRGALPPPPSLPPQV